MRHLSTYALFLALTFLAAAAALAQNPVPAPAIPVPAAQALQPPHDKAAIILLRGEVNDMMYRSIQRRVDIARKAGCTLIVYELDTYGGLLSSCLDICRFTRKLPGEHMHVVAWVNDKAISAGAITALSCEQLVMARGSVVGDCAPIAVSWTGEVIPLGAAERAKGASPLLEDLDESARQNHYDKTLLHAMVSPEIEIHELRNNTTGEVRYVGTEDKDKLLAEEENLPGGGKDRPWRYVELTDGPNQLLTVSADTALKMGISRATVDDEQQLRAALNIRGDLMVLDFNWAEVATTWLTQGWVRGMLFFAMLVFAYIEFSHPGVTIPGIAAIACLVLLVGAPFLTGLAQVWEIALIVVGVGIIVADLALFGGIGFFAVPGFILMAIGLVASFVPAEPGGGWIPTMPSTWDALRTGLSVLVFGSLGSLVAFYLLAKYLYLTPGFRKLQLAPAGTGGTSAANLRDSADRPADDVVFLGAIGRAATDLRPAGKVRFDDHLLDARSDGSFIPKDSEVVVIDIEGTRITVKPRPVAPPPPVHFDT